MTTEELDRAEKESFLQWRRQIAQLESNEKLILTPFERNLEVWKQLWRVIERSDLIIQVLDSRDPLLFRSIDLENYVNEFPEHKINLLLMNKADLLSEKQREHWVNYFKEQKINVLFFSARNEQIKIDQQLAELKLQEEERLAKEQEDAAYTSDNSDSESSVDIEEDKELDNAEVTENSQTSTDNGEVVGEEEVDREPKVIDTSLEAMTTKIMDRHELFDYAMALCKSNPHHDKESVVIGLAGYPNVGKSSTVNVLMQKKKVAVSATPGKTKHFQTLLIDENITLCDCPGLVFPTFVSTKAEMLCAGLMRVAEMREFIGPVSLVVRRIPKKVLETVYNVDLSQKAIPNNQFIDSYGPGRKLPLAIHFLHSYALSRGYVTRSKKPDEFKAAKIVLKDYIDGKILFCRAPPNVDQKLFDKYTIQTAFDNKKKN